jgi:nucleoporin GLE1
VPPLDSPSKQLMLDLIRDLDQVKLFSTELKKVHAFERKTYYETLDQIDREQEAVHTAALDKVAAFHDQVRGEAEAILTEHNRAEEEKRRHKEEQERKERERIQREKTEELRRQQEEAARLEAERKAQEAAKKKAEEEAERARQAAQEAKERQNREERERAEAEKRQQEADAKKAQEAQQAADEAAAQLTRTQQQQKVGASRLSAEEVAVQDRYVELHKALKEMRQSLRNAGKQNPLIKKTMGDMRRSIKKCVGQLRDGRGANKKQVGSHFSRVPMIR